MRSTDAHRNPCTATPGSGFLDAPLASLVFAVVDIKTTGLDPSADEIVEVAIIRTRGDGSTQDEYCTLVGDSTTSPLAERGGMRSTPAN
jgi:DNA polymerase III epsilon subunit-like protein